MYQNTDKCEDTFNHPLLINIIRDILSTHCKIQNRSLIKILKSEHKTFCSRTCCTLNYFYKAPEIQKKHCSTYFEKYQC